MSSEPARRRILVRCPNWLGDVVMSTPGLRALRRSHPDAWIVAQLPEAFVPLLEGTGFCDEVWPVAPRQARGGTWIEESRRIAEARFDLGLVIPESISSALRMRLGRVREVVGFARDPLRRWLLDRVVPAPPEWGRRRFVSRERFVLRLMSAVGAESEDVELALHVTTEETARFESVLARRGRALGSFEASRPVVLAPGAGFGSAKCWPPEAYAELGDRFAERGFQVVLLGSAGEAERISNVESAMRTTPIRFAGDLDLGAMKALISRSRLVVANDAGARHVAAAFGVPSVVFFGPTSVAKTADNLSSIAVLESDHDCRPCYLRDCPIDHRCLRSIDVDRAEEAALEGLDRVAHGAVG